MTATTSGRFLLFKLRFIEWLSTRSELSALQLRVAIRLVSAYNVRRGFAWPTLDKIAADLGASRRSVIRAIERFDQLNLIHVTRSRGRGHANEYRPNFEAMPQGDAYAAANVGKGDTAVTFSIREGSSEKVTSRAQKVTSRARKGDRPVTPTEEGTTEEDSTARLPAPRFAARMCPRDDIGGQFVQLGQALKYSAITPDAVAALRRTVEVDRDPEAISLASRILQRLVEFAAATEMMAAVVEV